MTGGLSHGFASRRGGRGTGASAALAFPAPVVLRPSWHRGKWKQPAGPPQPHSTGLGGHQVRPCDAGTAMQVAARPVPPVQNWAHGDNRHWAVCAVSACRTRELEKDRDGGRQGFAVTAGLSQQAAIQADPRRKAAAGSPGSAPGSGARACAMRTGRELVLLRNVSERRPCCRHPGGYGAGGRRRWR